MFANKVALVTGAGSGIGQVVAAALAAQGASVVATGGEIAQAVLWLCSDNASYVVGHALAVDGGLVIQ